MGTRVKNNEPFNYSAPRHGYLSIVVTMSSGTATLQKLAGDNLSGTWVGVTDAAWSGDGEDTIYAPHGQLFRFVLTGDAEAFVAG